MVSKNRRSSHLWKDFNHNEMVPDKGFVRQLKMLCPTFEVVWDKGTHVWEIWDFPADMEPYHVMRVKTKDKTYRDLGADILLNLEQNIFFSNNFTPKQICDYLDAADDRIQKEKERDMRNKIESIARDTFLYTHNVLQVQVPKH